MVSVKVSAALPWMYESCRETLDRPTNVPYNSAVGLICFACTLAEYAAGFRTDSRSQMLKHLRQHVELGHRVPKRAFARLSEELTTARDQVGRG
jgi:hypothetical protein